MPDWFLNPLGELSDEQVKDLKKRQIAEEAARLAQEEMLKASAAEA